MTVQAKWTNLLSLLMSAMAEFYLPCGKTDLRSVYLLLSPEADIKKSSDYQQISDAIFSGGIINIVSV